MTRLPAIVAALALMVAPVAAQSISLGDATYPESERQNLVEACRGLDAQSRMSLTSDVPDDIESGDAASEYALANLPFTLRDCRAADLV